MLPGVLLLCIGANPFIEGSAGHGEKGKKNEEEGDSARFYNFGS
jgi:hypothetical protein